MGCQRALTLLQNFLRAALDQNTTFARSSHKNSRRNTVELRVMVERTTNKEANLERGWPLFVPKRNTH